jgi:hypothetical protein
MWETPAAGLRRGQHRGGRPERALAKLAEPIRREARDRLDARLPDEGCHRGRL